MSEIIARLGRGEQEVQLQKSLIDGASHFELIVNGVFIMASYNALSSQMLVDMPLSEQDFGNDISLLVAGLGLGYTVREACQWEKVSRIDLVEINPHVIALNRGPLAEENRHCLDDPRVRVHQGDFFDFISRCKEGYHLICMDIDNGPMQLARRDNGRVYLRDFFAQIKERLLPGGMFWVWSCDQSQQLRRDLERSFGQAGERVVYEEWGGRRLPSYLYWGRKDEA